jgi:ankyrin repeat protein
MGDAKIPNIDDWTKKLGVALGEDDDPQEMGMFAGKDPNIKAAGIGGASALLHYAVSNLDIEETYRLIVEEGADPNARNHNMSTPLHVACRLGSLGLVQLLLENGSSLETKESKSVGGYTPLLHAVAENHIQIAELLLQEGSDPNVCDAGQGFSCLHLCARRNLIQMAKLLMAKGADIEQCDKDNLSPSYWAKECRNENFLQIRGVPEPEEPSLDDLLAGLQEAQAERERILKPPAKAGGKKKGGKKKKK